MGAVGGGDRHAARRPPAGADAAAAGSVRRVRWSRVGRRTPGASSQDDPDSRASIRRMCSW
ncbi:MAG TPA: hypothetical protein VGW38_27330, partial [Chloroflexota bacterium]|nr:hypothetical protein [Chloroflexota bacterium]